MTDVLLLNSPLFREVNPLYDEDSLPPFGLGYIGTRLLEQGFSVSLVDAVAECLSFAQVQQRIRRSQPRVLGVNIFTTNYEIVRDLICSLADTVEHVVLGGLSTRSLYVDVFDWDYPHQIDVVLGDGESIMGDIVTGEVRESPAAETFNRRYFEVNNASQYFVSDISAVTVDRSLFVNEPVHHPQGFVEGHLVASRGCIYNCAFCAAARSLNRDLAVRERTADSLHRELTEVEAATPAVTSIRVLDDLFLKGRKSIKNATSVFSQHDFTWRSMAHVMTFDKVDVETLVEMRLSGCSEVFVGIESGSPRILNAIHKTGDPELIHANLARVLEAGIPVKGYFIYGFPNETEADFQLTFSLAERLKASASRFGTKFRTSVFQFRPYHGTELYHSLMTAGDAKGYIGRIEPDADLSSLVGRLQFNFHSGNYSAEPLDVVHRYIYKTVNLTDPKEWGLE